MKSPSLIYKRRPTLVVGSHQSPKCPAHLALVKMCVYASRTIDPIYSIDAFGKICSVKQGYYRIAAVPDNVR